MAHLTNFSFEFFYKIFTEDASQPLLYHNAKKSKMTKNSNQGGGSCLNTNSKNKIMKEIKEKRILIKFSSLSAPTKIEELTAGSDEKTQREYIKKNCYFAFFFLEDIVRPKGE